MKLERSLAASSFIAEPARFLWTLGGIICTKGMQSVPHDDLLAVASGLADLGAEAFTVNDLDFALEVLTELIDRHPAISFAEDDEGFAECQEWGVDAEHPWDEPQALADYVVAMVVELEEEFDQVVTEGEAAA